MAIPNRGHGSCLAIGKEATYGTPVTRTNLLRVGSLSMKRTIDRVRIPHLGTKGSVSTNRREHFTASDKAGGSLEIPMAFDDSTVLLCAHALGAVATTGAGPYTHACTLAVPGALESLTLENGYGTGDSEVFRGSILPGLEISATAGEIVKLVVPGIISQTTGGLEATSSLTFPISTYIKHDQASVFSFNGITPTINSFSLKVDRKYTDRMHLGSVLTKEPTPSDFLTVDFSIVVEYGQIAGLNAAWLADTESNATISFVGPGNNFLGIALQNCHITDISRPISGPGIITQTVSFVAQSDGTNEGASLTFINDNANYDDNG